MERKSWKKWLAVGCVGLMTIGVLAGCGAEKKEAHTGYRIGLVQIVQHPALDEAAKGIADGLAKSGLKEGKDFTLDRQNAQGDQSNLNTIIGRFINDKSNLIFAVATPSAQAAANATSDIPIVATAVTDFVAARLVHSDDKPGTNVTGTTDRSDIPAQVDLMLKLTPQIHTIGTIYNSSEINSQLQAEQLKAAAATKGLAVKEYTVSSVNDIPQAAAQMAAEVDAVYIPTDNVVASALPALIAVTNPAHIPVYGAEAAHVKNGAVASLSVDFYTLGLRAGEMGAAILQGKAKPESMPVEAQKDLKLIINEKEVHLLGIQVPAELQAKAEVVR